MTKPNLYLAYDSSWARYEVRSINGHGQTILSCHFTLKEAQEQAQLHAANGSIGIDNDAVSDAPGGGIHRRIRGV